jgi:putative ABC transport system permease protein
MQLVESVRLALQSIWGSKLRSLMTVLGNIVAVGSIVTVVSLIQGMNAMVSTAIVTQVGADAFRVERTPITRTDDDIERVRANPLLTLSEADAIRAFDRASIASVMAQATTRASVSYRDQVVDQVQIQGVTSDYLAFSEFDAERGRMMSAIEVERSRPVVLLGADTTNRVFGDENPLDKTILIQGVHFRVVGVSKKKGGFLGNSLDSFAIIPLGAYMKLFGSHPSLSLSVKPVTPVVLPTAMDDATVALRVSRHLKGTQENNFGLITSDTVLGIYHQATTGIFAVLVGVVALSLVVGGIVIMNIMLMVVSERTREIGLRKALGARRSDIMWQVLTESVTLSTCGGIVGIMIGAAIGRLISALTPLPATLEWWSVALGIGITAAVGLGFGLYPASRAARLDPIEALRRE